MSIKALSVTIIITFAGITGWGQTSKKLDLNQGARDRYHTIATLVQQFYEADYISWGSKKADVLVSDEPGIDKITYDLAGPCLQDEQLSINWPRGDEMGSVLTSLAVYTVRWRHELPLTGLPQQQIDTTISAFETNVISAWEARKWRPLTDAEEESQSSDPMWHGMSELAKQFNRYRPGKRNIPVFILDGGCGAGEVDVKVSIHPANGQLFIIPVFFFKLCQAQHLDPMDLSRCDRWTELVHETVSPLAGDYIYLAKWTDGSVRCGKLGITTDTTKTRVVIDKLQKNTCALP